MEELRRQAEGLVDHLMQRFPLRSRPVVVWKTLRVTAGKAYYRNNVIVLSTVLINDWVRLESTLTHEYAHLLAHLRHGRNGLDHGPNWRRAMHDLGQHPQVRHTYEVKRNQSWQEVVYRCDRCGDSLIRRRRLPRGRTYRHVGCGGVVKLVAVERTQNTVSHA